jgi:aldehyde oxidoreductase
MTFSLNGERRDYSGDPELSLLEYLRNVEGIHSPKDGCSGEGSCGCCSVLVTRETGTRAVLSCTTNMKAVGGSAILTAEGLEKRIADAFSKAFVKAGGIQCGFCTPGIVMQAVALLRKNLDPDRNEIARAIGANLCRCTGYVKIVDAILLAAESIRLNRDIEFGESGAVGTRHPKYDALDAVLGKRPFVCDLDFPGMKHGALKFSDHPRARVLSIDTEAAESLEGVLRVFTAEDIPGDRHIGLILQDWPMMIASGETTQYLGDVLACVVARSEAIARKAVSLIRVDYEVLEPVADAFTAMKPESPVLHPGHPGGNVLSVSSVKRGDAGKALASSAFVAKGTYRTQTIEHAFLEPECCLAKPWTSPAGGGVEVFSQGQGAYEDRKQIAKILGLAQNRVKVVQVQNGGGFGGKEDMTVQGHAALAAYLSGLPVRVALTRNESILMHPKRHPMEMDYELGCDSAGRLTALRARIVGDSGAYASVGMKVLERAAGHAASAYFVPSLDVEATAVYTNNIPNGAMRGFGVNQVAFAIEGSIDELCKMGGFDRWGFRSANVVRDGMMISTGQVVRNTGASRCLDALKPYYDEAVKAGKAVGLAAGIKNTGIGNGMADVGRAMVEVLPNGRVAIHHGWTEMGQGVHTMAIQTLVEETGIDPALVDVVVETDREIVCGMTTSSRATSLVGNALIDACRALKADLAGSSLAALAGRTYPGEWTCDWTTQPGTEKPGEEILTHYSYGYAAQLVVLDPASARIEAVYAAHDAGKIMNPSLFEGQIEGAVAMGLGYAISEELVSERGRPVKTKLRDMGLLRARDMPEVKVIGIEVPDAHGPYGVKGVGEIGLVPTAAAVANALSSLDGTRRYSLPLRDKRLLARR